LHNSISPFNHPVADDNISPLLLDPSLSEVERKAIEAWQRELKLQCSPISDLFMG